MTSLRFSPDRFPVYLIMDKNSFQFGIEAEFLLVDRQSSAPLSYRDLNFASLAAIVDGIPTQDFGISGFNIKPLHSKATPYLIEGYYLTDTEMNPVSLLPKGIEIRTPARETMSRTLLDLKQLYEKLREALAVHGYDTAIISHHPTEARFKAPPNYKRHDYWQWALTAATTFGPDINISLPEEYSANIEISQLAARINYYMPSVVALTLDSPLLEGNIWQLHGLSGKSIRTYRRSIWAPLFYVHEKPSLRFEFKGFEMSRRLEDYNAFYLICLALLLDEKLSEKAPDETRIYELGQIAVNGLEMTHTRQIAYQVLEAAARTAERLGFVEHGLNALALRIENKRLPADEIIDAFRQEESINATLSRLKQLHACELFEEVKQPG